MSELSNIKGQIASFKEQGVLGSQSKLVEQQLDAGKAIIDAAGGFVSNEEAMEIDAFASKTENQVRDFMHRQMCARGVKSVKDAYCRFPRF